MNDFSVPTSPETTALAVPAVPAVPEKTPAEIASQEAIGACVEAATVRLNGAPPETREEISEALWAIVRIQGFRAVTLAQREADGAFSGGDNYEVSKEISAFVRAVKTYQEIRGTLRGRKSAGSRFDSVDDERGKLINAFTRTA